MQTCVRCGFDEPSIGTACSSCGLPLDGSCPVCQAPNRPTANFCDNCGCSLQAAAPREATSTRQGAAPAVDLHDDGTVRIDDTIWDRSKRAERKIITVLFADIVNSTQLVDGLDPERAVTRLAPALNAMISAVHRYGGTVSNVRGDGLTALFGAPIALEDHAVRACLAGVAMLEGVRAVNDEGISIRAGMHSGEVLVRSIVSDFTQAYEATGPTVHIASRMEQLARPNTIRTTRATRDLAKGVVHEHFLGVTQVRGVSGALEQYEFTSAAPSRTRWELRVQLGLTSFVGRRRELEMLRDAWRKASMGDGQCVVLVGEPGIGKSRVVHEFLASDEKPQWLARLAGAASYESQSAYLVATRLLREWLSIKDGASPADIVQRVEERLPAQGDTSTAGLLAFLGVAEPSREWSSLEPEQRREQMVNAVVGFILREAQRVPLVLVVEDLQWLDSGTTALIRRLSARLAGHRILLILTCRPEADLGWLNDGCMRVSIESLPSDDAFSLLTNLVGAAPQLARLKEVLIAQTDGTPLFLEEIVQSFAEQEILAGGTDGYEVARPLEEITVPATVQAVIAARIDRLLPRHKELLQNAAVLGERAERELLREIVELAKPEFDQSIALLEGRGFLQRSDPPGEDYAFKHGLTRDVVYESMLSDARRAAHIRIVQAIEAQSRERPREHVEALARHAMFGMDWRRAATYFRSAAEKASELSAFRESVTYLRSALRSLERLEPTSQILAERTDTLLSLRRSLFALGDLEPIVEHLTQAEALAESIGDEARLAAAGTFKSNIHSHQGRLSEAIEAGTRALEIARRIKDANLIVSASIVLSLAYEFGGRDRDVVRLLGPISGNIDAAMDHPQFATTASFSVQTLSILAGSQASLGQFEAAENTAARALEIGRRLQRPYDLGLASYYLGLVHLRHGRMPETIAASQGGLDVAVGFVIPWLESQLGFAHVVDGNVEAGRPHLERALQRSREMQLDFLQTRIRAYQAFAALRASELASAETLAVATLESASQHHYRGLETWVLRLLACIRARKAADGLSNAVGLLTTAHEIASRLDLAPEQAHCAQLLCLCHEGRGDQTSAAPFRDAARKAYAAMGINPGRSDVLAMWRISVT